MSYKENRIDPNNLENKKLTCRDCGNRFLFTVAEQKRYLEKGLKKEPSRCPECRKKNRERINATMLKVICRICGKNGLVPKIPEGALDTLCSECFEKVKKAYLEKSEALSWRKLES